MGAKNRVSSLYRVKRTPMLPGAAAVAAARWSSAAAPRRSSWRTPPDAGPHLKPGIR